MKAAPKKTARFRRPRQEKRELLDRARLVPWVQGALADRDDPYTYLEADAPALFSVSAMLCNDPGGPWLWIGIDADPDDPKGKGKLFAIIGGETLRQLAIDVLARHPPEKRQPPKVRRQSSNSRTTRRAPRARRAVTARHAVSRD